MWRLEYCLEDIGARILSWFVLDWMPVISLLVFCSTSEPGWPSSRGQRWSLCQVRQSSWLSKKRMIGPVAQPYLDNTDVVIWIVELEEIFLFKLVILQGLKKACSQSFHVKKNSRSNWPGRVWFRGNVGRTGRTKPSEVKSYLITLVNAWSLVLQRFSYLTTLSDTFNCLTGPNSKFRAGVHNKSYTNHLGC